MTKEEPGPLDRVLRDLGFPGIVHSLSDGLSGSDFTTLLLEVMRRRARAITARTLMANYRRDRFVAPASIPFRQLRRAEDLLLSALPEHFEVLALAPLLPLGAHSTIATVDQNKVVTTVRGHDVAADPTNGLALEAAVRRQHLRKREPRSISVVQLAAIQRVVRAQRFQGAGHFAHFTQFGLVSAGRDVGHHNFERDAALEHITFGVAGLLAAGATPVRVEWTDLTRGGSPGLLEELGRRLSTQPELVLADRPDRVAGRGYYVDFCFKIFADIGEERFEVGDGGFVDWTQKLVGDVKERMLISGLGVDRIATILPA
jgi:hypothetical protein